LGVKSRLKIFTLSDLTKSEIKGKLEEYEKTPQYQRFLEFQKFTAENLSPIFMEVDKYVSILSSRFEKFKETISQSGGRFGVRP